MSKLALSSCLVAVFLFAGCGGGKQSARPASKTTSAAKGSQTALTAQKPASPEKTSTPPKPIPTAKTAGSTTVKPPAPAAGKQSETWAFKDVDIDGDSKPESGVVLYDASQELLLVWWSDADDLDGDGADDAYEALVWITKTEVGVVIDVAGGGSLACASDGSTDACVVCDAGGACEVSAN